MYILNLVTIDFNINNFENRNLVGETYIFNPFFKTQNILFKRSSQYCCSHTFDNKKS